ncbi:hypothetical protein [Candidatus Ichthyocystis sparus]|uniref:hypothetical protein n=1 Tax=Candidatus Ichthyocystis sparus TaxID=1561004 RepID=UPI000B8618C5|nr:hypothetical protein [Candidatus Ichthyocystis sparus]
MARQVSSVLYLRFVRVNCHFLYNFVCECRLVFVYNGDGAFDPVCGVLCVPLRDCTHFSSVAFMQCWCVS